MESRIADAHVGTSNDGFVFYPIAKDKKCFSFELRTTVLPHILLSTVPRVINNERLDILLHNTGNSMIRLKNVNPVSSAPTPNIINDRELHGFWIRWLDDYLLEFGRDNDSKPTLSYRSPHKLIVNFVGILSYGAEGEWVIHGEPKCGQYNVPEKVVTETKCKIPPKCIMTPKCHLTSKFHLPKKSQLPSNDDNVSENIQNKNFLEKSQIHILNQIKNQREIFKISKFQSKQILLEFQELIRKHFKNAESYQNQIYGVDNEIYCPLKANCFNEITKEYFEFMDELQMKLSLFKDTTNETLITHCGGCCSCLTVKKCTAENSTVQNAIAHSGTVLSDTVQNLLSQTLTETLNIKAKK